MRVILVPIADRPECVRVLRAAFPLAQSLSANLIGCHIRPHRDSKVEVPGGLLTQGLGSFEADWAKDVSVSQSAKHSADARKLFEAAAHQHGVEMADSPVGSGPTRAIWQEQVGSPGKILAIHGPVSDMLIVSRPAAKGGQKARLFLLSALMQSHRPVLVMPQRASKVVGKRILIAWNGRPEAVRSVTGALPLLRQADKVTIATIGKVNDPLPTAAHLATYLRHWGVSAKRVRTKGGHEGERLLEVFRDTESDLLVMGAYSRHRLRELLFGGMTEFMLGQRGLPLLLNHL
jgi:nucleotide-binding universal stress UspA family protein